MPILTTAELDFLDDLLPDIPFDVEIIIGDVPEVEVEISCHALVKAATALPGRIIIDRQFYEPGTASFLALVGHELWHEHQYATIPNFIQVYTEAERERRESNLGIMANVYEAEAYHVELEVFQAALQEGYPEGSYTPLLVGRAIN